MWGLALQLTLLYSNHITYLLPALVLKQKTLSNTRLYGQGVFYYSLVWGMLSFFIDYNMPGSVAFDNELYANIDTSIPFMFLCMTWKCLHV